jgi:hypothetical protein
MSLKIRPEPGINSRHVHNARWWMTIGWWFATAHNTVADNEKGGMPLTWWLVARQLRVFLPAGQPSKSGPGERRHQSQSESGHQVRVRNCGALEPARGGVS